MNIDFDQPLVTDTRCGFVAIIGRPNVGKSTLLNHFLGQKISITSKKPQTTRHQIFGIKTEGKVQTVFVDTPGLHLGFDKALNRYMNKAASTAVKDVDLILFMTDRTALTDEDVNVLTKLSHVDCPVAWVINKVDILEDKTKLLPHIEKVSKEYNFDAVYPLSALRGANIDSLDVYVEKHIPDGPFYYPEDQITDKSIRFLIAEMVREKIMRLVGDELPYSVTVEIEQFEMTERLVTISALILVEREGQRKIVIGEKGATIKRIGTEARQDAEKLLDQKVMLNLWVKVKSNWSDDERALKSLGYD